MRHVMPPWPPVLIVIFVVRVLCFMFTLFSPNENLRGGESALPDFLSFFLYFFLIPQTTSVIVLEMQML